MFTVFWSTLGFPLVQILPKGHRFNAEYLCNHILHEIDRIRPGTTDENARRKIVLHFDNATSHTATVSLAFLDWHRMRRAPQPPFLPDLAPSDFYLFGKLKTTLMRSVFENKQGFLDGIMRVLDRIMHDEFESVFEEWVARLDVCIQRGGDEIK
jgi:histone-lysine N-methyltransferase SETMAR